MNILVTGGAGFIGSHVADEYIRMGHHVTVVDDLSTGKKKNLNPKARFVKADIQSPGLSRVFKQGRFDVVNHHAAQIDVRCSVIDPGADARINILGLLNILELSRIYKVRKIIFSASGGTYYGECSQPARESDRPFPLSPYGVSKLASEYYLRAYESLHGLIFTVLRYGNVFGPRQDPHGEAGVVSIFSQKIMAKKGLIIFGDGCQQRDYVYVKDVAKANVLALREKKCNVYNIGMGRGVSVNQLFDALKKISGYKLDPIYQSLRAGELFRSCLNIGKAKKQLKWQPRYGFVDGLRETFEYIKNSK